MGESAEMWEQKMEELMALESIYGSDFSLLGAEGSSSGAAEIDISLLATAEMPSEGSVIECQIRISVDVPDAGMTVTLDPSATLKTESVAPTGTKVHHLPPIALAISMPPDYPLHKCPKIELTGIWLSRGAKDLATRSLYDLWEHNGPGMPICFVWIDWLRSSLLKCLGATEQLFIFSDHSQDLESDCQPGPSSEEGDAESVIVRILRYNAVRTQQLFREGTWKCPVCMEDKIGKYFVRLSKCSHMFCMECFAEYCRVNVLDGQVDLNCPEHECTTKLEPHTLQEILNKKDYERWEAILLQRTLDKMKDVHYCPRCSFVCVEESGCFAQCEKCFFAYCTKCYEAWHPGSDCITVDQDIASVKGATPQETLRLRKDRANQALSQAAIRTCSKECPGCGFRITRSEGCNKMKCTFCDTSFCYKCGAVISDYSHFWDGSCILFDDEEIRRLAQLEAPVGPAAMAAQDRRLMRDLILEQGRENGVRVFQTRCPFCGQQNAKSGNNNHIRCWACSLGYCHLCGCGLGKKMGSHFSQGRCKQHTES